jgi:hypothetical protein
MLVVSADAAVSVGLVCVYTVLIAESTLQVFLGFIASSSMCAGMSVKS